MEQHQSFSFQQLIDNSFPIFEGLDTLFSPNDLDFPLIIDGFDNILEGLDPLIQFPTDYIGEDIVPMKKYLYYFFQVYFDPLLKTRFLENPVTTAYHIKYVLKRLDVKIQGIRLCITDLNNKGGEFSEFADGLEDIVYELEVFLNYLICFVPDLELVSIWENPTQHKPELEVQFEKVPPANIWSLYTRFEYIKLAFPEAFKSIDKLRDPSQRYYAMAQLMSISVHNAKHLLNGTYIGNHRRVNENELEDMKDFVINNFNKPK